MKLNIINLPISKSAARKYYILNSIWCLFFSRHSHFRILIKWTISWHAMLSFTHQTHTHTDTQSQNGNSNLYMHCTHSVHFQTISWVYWHFFLPFCAIFEVDTFIQCVQVGWRHKRLTWSQFNIKHAVLLQVQKFDSVCLSVKCVCFDISNPHFMRFHLFAALKLYLTA